MQYKDPWPSTVVVLVVFLALFAALSLVWADAVDFLATLEK